MTLFTKTRTSPLETFILFVLVTAAYTYISLHRFVAADEGFYLYASKLVLNGKALYRDFFYPQMPGFPYLYGLILKIIGFSWTSARVLAAIITSLIVVLTFNYVKVSTDKKTAYFSILILVCTGLFTFWQPIAKTYGLSTLSIILAYIFYEKARTNLQSTLLILCGLCVGISVNVRLFYVATIPVLLLGIGYGEAFRKEKGKAILFFLLGGFITFIPHLYYMVTEFDSYWFNNVGYHINRSHRTPDVDYKSKIKISKILLGFLSDDRADGLQYPTLFYTNILYAFYCLIKKEKINIAFFLGITLFLIHIIPNPVHYQYFSTTIPFFVICTSILVYKLSKDSFVLTSLITTLLLLQSLYYIPDATARYLINGEGVKGITNRNRERARLETTARISKEIEFITPDNGKVISFWPGYLFEGSRELEHGLENQFWVRISHKMNNEDRDRFHITSPEKIRKSLKDQNIKTIVGTNQQLKRNLPGIKLENVGFSLYKKIKGIKIYKRIH